MKLNLQRHREAPSRRAQRTLWLLGMFTLITATAIAGGNREQEQPQDEQGSRDEGSRIEIEDPENQLESDQPTEEREQGDDTPESTEDGSRQDGSRLLRDEDGNVLTELDRPAWAVAFHENRAVFEEEVSNTIERGYIPAGMEATEDGQFTILYSIANSGVPERWLLESYTADTINEDLSERLASGLTPLAFSVLDETFYVMFGTGGNEVSAWRIHETGLETEALQSTIASYQDDGYSIVDISIDPSTDKMWYLFVRQDNRTGGPDSSLFINAYPNGEQTVAGISSDFLDGRGIPFGLASGDEISTVMFDSTAVRQIEE
ncbi:MAG: hypothetical protein ACOCYB_09650 [Alkalispirochaeta sp.]